MRIHISRHRVRGDLDSYTGRAGDVCVRVDGLFRHLSEQIASLVGCNASTA